MTPQQKNTLFIVHTETDTTNLTFNVTAQGLHNVAFLKFHGALLYPNVSPREEVPSLVDCLCDRVYFGCEVFHVSWVAAKLLLWYGSTCKLQNVHQIDCHLLSLLPISQFCP